MAHLKSLELQGYKTFASRVNFEFAGSITAIVGPNGSGKSNIADSLRWVLGEQSYSLLRGKKTEDMIFSGSELRPRAGMASATVTFDNSEGWLPIDYSEVAITRRAYRDGQNEYLINGQRVRLKDVSELLAQSGLAERTYTIIGQGLVDAALSLKAEERRRLFEEAAGIGLHRSRREEALRRLEATQRNLERVHDILAELEPRLRSLEKQARRAIEYNQVRSDLQTLMREWYGYHWHQAQAELAAAREQNRLQQQAAEQAKTELEQVERAAREQRQRAAGLRTELMELRRAADTLYAGREALARQGIMFAERARSLAGQQPTVEGGLAAAREEAVLHTEWLAEADADLRRRQAEQAELAAQSAAARQQLQQKQAERDRLNRALQEARQQTTALTIQAASLQARLAEKAVTGASQQTEIDTHQAGAAKARQRGELARQQAEQRLAAVSHQERAVHELEGALEAGRQQRSELDAARRASEQNLARLQGELARLRAQLQVVEAAERALSGYAEGSKVLIQQSGRAGWKNLLGAFASRLMVDQAYETAIAAALGDTLDGVLFGDDADLPQALDLLGGQAKRGVLIPLGRMTGRGERADMPGGAAAIGWAADLVKAAPELAPAVNTLLGDVLIVADRVAAEQAAPQLPTGGKAVTLKGEVFSANGVVTAGYGGQTVLTRPRQQKELGGQIAEAQAGLQAEEERLAASQEAVRKLVETEKEQNEQLRQARRELENRRVAHSQERAAVEETDRLADWHAAQAQKLAAHLEAAGKDAVRLTQEASGLAPQVEAGRARQAELNAALNLLVLDDFHAQAAHWSAREVSAARLLEEARARRAERQVLLQRAQAAVEAGMGQLARITADLAELAASAEQVRQEEAGLAEKIAALEAAIQPVESDLSAAEQKGAEAAEQEQTARQHANLLESRYAQTRITLVKRQDALDSLHRRIEDDFGLVSFDYADQVAGQPTLPIAGMVEQLPQVSILSPELEENVRRLRAQLRRMGAINPEAETEFRQVKERYEFMRSQIADLAKAEADLREVIHELDTIMQAEFRKTFNAVAGEFRQIFSRQFGGGSARLVLTDPDDLTNTGIDIEARLPGRRTQGLSLLSGGERSLTATALVFALLKVSPTPFCLLDEVDAMLDEANVGRFRDLLRELSEATQFIIVTHNRNTVQVADSIYGVTMGRDSASQVVSLKLDELDRVVE